MYNKLLHVSIISIDSSSEQDGFIPDCELIVPNWPNGAKPNEKSTYILCIYFLSAPLLCAQTLPLQTPDHV